MSMNKTCPISNTDNCSLHGGGFARGSGVGRGLGVGATLGVGVILGVEVDVGVAVAVGVTVGVGVISCTFHYSTPCLSILRCSSFAMASSSSYRNTAH